MELEALQQAEGKIKLCGATLIAVCPQRREYVRQMAKKLSLTFNILTDEGNGFARKLGLVFTLPDYLREIYLQFGIDLPRFNKDESWTLPLPARLIIDRDSLIRSVSSDPDYTVRPEPEETIEILKSL